MAAEAYSPAGAPKAEKDYRSDLRKSEILTDWNKRAEIIATQQTVRYGPVFISARLQNSWQISLSLTRKVKGAVRRNRIKRIIREVYRQSKALIGQPHAIIFTVTANFDKIDFHKLQHILLKNYGLENDDS